MDGAVRWVRRLPAGSWVFDSGLALVAGGLATALFVSMPVGKGRPRGGFVLGVWAGVGAHLAVGGAAAIPRSGAVLIVASGLAGAALALPPFFLGPAILVAVYSAAATAASASQWPAWRSPAATRAGSLYRFGGVLAGGRAKLCRRQGPAW